MLSTEEAIETSLQCKDKKVVAELKMTKREFDLLERIGPSELLRQAWAGAEKKARAPNVLALVGLANATAAWVASVVLSEAELARLV